MMNNNTRATIQTAFDTFGTDTIFNVTMWNALPVDRKNGAWVANWETARRYVNWERVTRRFYFTTRELVDMLNECAGDDCYSCDWHFEIDEQGRVYEDRVLGFRFISLTLRE